MSASGEISSLQPKLSSSFGSFRFSITFSPPLQVPFSSEKCSDDAIAAIATSNMTAEIIILLHFKQYNSYCNKGNNTNA